MRLHAYDPNPLTRRALILLNGKRLSKCIMADEELGLVEVYSEDPPPPRSKEWPTKLLWGQVRIVDPEDAEVLREVYLRCDRG